MDASLAHFMQNNLRFVSWVQIMAWKVGQAKLLLPLRSDWICSDFGQIPCLTSKQHLHVWTFSFWKSVNCFSSFHVARGKTILCLVIALNLLQRVLEKKTVFLIGLFWHGGGLWNPLWFQTRAGPSWKWIYGISVLFEVSRILALFSCFKLYLYSFSNCVVC